MTYQSDKIHIRIYNLIKRGFFWGIFTDSSLTIFWGLISYLKVSERPAKINFLSLNLHIPLSSIALASGYPKHLENNTNNNGIAQHGKTFLLHGWLPFEWGESEQLLIRSMNYRCTAEGPFSLQFLRQKQLVNI